mmetsp:Transcript_136592/g.291750  ORF Transcript_136592/g.291750 Transcript_136592/m.291750 type:complete len:241 (-) Transcript_136592:3-725(-)
MGHRELQHLDVIEIPDLQREGDLKTSALLPHGRHMVPTAVGDAEPRNATARGARIRAQRGLAICVDPHSAVPPANWCVPSADSPVFVGLDVVIVAHSADEHRRRRGWLQHSNPGLPSHVPRDEVHPRLDQGVGAPGHLARPCSCTHAEPTVVRSVKCLRLEASTGPVGWLASRGGAAIVGAEDGCGHRVHSMVAACEAGDAGSHDVAQGGTARSAMLPLHARGELRTHRNTLRPSGRHIA